MFIKRLHIIICLLAVLMSAEVMAAKTDIIYLKNGDRITGEIKSLTRGKLELSTDHMDTVSIEWDDIQEIVSKTGQVVEKLDGDRLYGPLIKPENADILVVDTSAGKVSVHTDDISFMYPVGTSFWDRLDLTASLGFNWDKGSNVGKYSLGLNSTLWHTETITRASFSTEVTTQDSATTTTRSLFDANHIKFTKRNNFIIYYGNIEQNDELGVDFRALVGAGYGWVPIRTQNNWFSISAGLGVNREIPSNGEAETNLEASGALVYDYYTYSSPERSFRTGLTLYPSITDFGRWRATFSNDFRVELYKDLFWKLSLYATYDSAPISIDGASSDYGITSAIAYKF